MLLKSKALATILAACMLAAALAGCAGNTTAPATTAAPAPTQAPAADTPAAATDAVQPSEFVTLKFIYPGELLPRMEEFLKKEYATKLKDELNLGIEITWIPWGQYWDKKTLMLAANEQIDWYWDGITNVSGIYAKKQCQDITELLSKYGQNIKKVIPEKNLSAATIGGKVYAIPSAYTSSAEMLTMVDVRKDLLDGVGMSDIKTAEDLELFGQKVKAQYPDKKGGSFGVPQALARYYSDQELVFPVNAYLLVVGQNDNKVYSFYETDVFKKIAQFNRALYQEGLYTDEVTTKYEEHDARMKTGQYIWGEGSIAKPTEIIGEVKKGDPNAKLKVFLLSPEKPKYITSPGNEGIYIPYSAKYPDRAMQYLDWIYKSQDNYLCTVYGVAGTDYAIENGKLKLMYESGMFYEWMFRNVNYTIFPTDMDDATIQEMKTWDDGAKYANTFGFTFDSTNVKTEEARLIAEVGQTLRPIMTGFVDYDANIDKAVKGLKDAGIEKYVAEFQKQLDAYMAGQK